MSMIGRVHRHAGGDVTVAWMDLSSLTARPAQWISAV
jgi:hypothetical protein